MTRQQTGKKHKRGKTRFAKIGIHAAILGVSRTHLYRVLTGERSSPLLERYHALLEKIAQTNPKGNPGKSQKKG